MKVKKLGIIFLTLSLIMPVTAQKKKTINPGEIWPDDKGVHINAHGGGILYQKGKYYWFGEHKSDHTSSALVGVTCYSSKDLVNWKNEGIAMPVVEDDPSSDIISGCVIERPKVVYNALTKKYVMWFHLELKGQGYSAARAAVAISDKVTGPYKLVKSGRVNPGIYPINMTDAQKANKLELTKNTKWWTPEWLEMVNEGVFIHRDLEGGQMSRDMTIFVDDDGKAYHIYSSEENLTLHIAELTDDYQGHTGRYIRLFPGGHNEAPAILKRNGEYWMITSGCTGWDPNEARMFSSKNIMGEWTAHENPCVGDGAKLTFESQSTYILKVEGKKDAYIYLGDRWRPKHPSDARYIWLPIQFEGNKPVLKWMDSWSLNMFK